MTTKKVKNLAYSYTHLLFILWAMYIDTYNIFMYVRLFMKYTRVKQKVSKYIMWVEISVTQLVRPILNSILYS